MPTFFQIKTFINYWLEAVDEHSLHSPFFFDFYTNIIKQRKSSVPVFEQLRSKLQKDHREIEVVDFGAGAQRHDSRNPNKRKVSNIAKTSLSSARYSQLYLKIIEYFKFKNIIELGTSLGINTLYLAHHQHAKVTTFEGSPVIADIARTTFEFAGVSNIKLIEGNIDHTLPSFLQNIGNFDMAFIDANHRYEPTLHYFDWLARKATIRTVLIFDDIHYSSEMEKAWNDIRHNALVYASADLYRCGLLFFDPSLNKQHVVLQF